MKRAGPLKPVAEGGFRLERLHVLPASDHRRPIAPRGIASASLGRSLREATSRGLVEQLEVLVPLYHLVDVSRAC